MSRVLLVNADARRIPLADSGTTAMVAARLGRNAVLLDCNRGYLAEQATARTSDLQIELGVA